MAEFCKKCSIEIFGQDFGDFSDLSTEADTAAKLYPVVLCEGCGFVQVDHTGECISTDCLKTHGTPKTVEVEPTTEEKA